MDIHDLKASIRSDIRAKRRLISNDELKASDDALLEAFKSASKADLKLNEAYSRSKSIAVYKAVGGELPCDALAAYFRSEGKTTVYPRTKGDVMDFCAVKDPSSELVKGDFGIPAPSLDALAADPSDIGIVILPGIAFDEQKRRLGQGKGFYDRWVSSFDEGHRPLLVGVCMKFQMVPEVPSEAFDIPADVLLCI